MVRGGVDSIQALVDTKGFGKASSLVACMLIAAYLATESPLPLKIVEHGGQTQASIESDAQAC